MFKSLLSHRNRIILAVLLLIFFSQHVFSQSYQSPLLSNGGADTHVYKSDTVVFEATAIDDGGEKFQARTFTSGLLMLHSPFLTIFYIPLKYALNDNFQISFSLPYLTKTLVYDDTHYIKSGYGDTMFGLTYYLKPHSFLSSSTTARITLPTGNVNAQDFYYYIPMGYGGYTTSLQESISTEEFNVSSFRIRLFISGIGIYYFGSTQRIDQVEKNNFDSTFAWAAVCGAEINPTENFNLQLKINYINIEDRRYESSTAPGIWSDADDSVRQVNILPFIKYQFLDDVSGQFGIIYPLITRQSTGVTQTFDAKWKMAIGITKKFSDKPSLKP